MITQEEDFEACIPELKPMMAELGAEIALSRPLNVDWAQYSRLGGMGVVKLLTCRKEGKLLGFCVIAIAPNLHAIGESMALITGIFCPKANRKLGVGNALLAIAEQKKIQYNWGELLIASRTVAPLDMILARRGYTAEETIFAKRKS
jgi:hypothetical protein